MNYAELPKQSGPYAAVQLLALLLLGACSGSLQHKQLAVTASGLPPVHELSATPHHPQEIHHCGPAALATALGATGHNTSPGELAKLVYVPERQGSLAIEMAAAVRHLGYVPYQLQPSLADLLDEIAHGRPVVVLQNLGLAWLPRWHYAVAIGYDLPHQQIILRSGIHQRVLTGMATFERTWRRGDYWALLVLPPGQLPAHVDESRYLEAAAGLERTTHALAALESYRAAVKRWPESPLAWMALGNGAYVRGDLDTADRAYRQVLLLDAAYAPAYNNLAQALADQKQWDEAERMARRAIDIGGTHLEEYRSTLQTILQSKTIN